MKLQEELRKNKVYWGKILGEDVYKKLEREEKGPEIAEMPKEQWRQELVKVKEIFDKVLDAVEGWEAYDSKGVFIEFYRFFGRTAVLYAQGKDLQVFKNRTTDIISNLYKKIEWIPLRVLIQDIHRCKDAGLLRGNSSEEEYMDYCRHFLTDGNYVRELCEKYTEMTNLLFRQIVNLVCYLEEIVNAVANDREILQKYFFDNRSFENIEYIDSGQSDAHKQGRTVATVCFDNGRKIIYKPRSLGKESCFEKLYALFCEQAGITYDEIKVWNGGNYGWQEFVYKSACKDTEGVKRYFLRTGILLFLCYCVSASDIHGENIIANGEIPRLIDLEVFPGVQTKRDVHNAKELVREQLKNSVLSVGILPMAIWNHEGKGVIVNALHGKQRATTPFKIPVICNPNSSDISIGYREGVINLADSLPAYEDVEVNPADYTKEICGGFQSAYEYFLMHKKELNDRFQEFFQMDSRYLIRHTQQYSMMLRTSFYPDFMESEEKRRLFLYSLDQRCTRDMERYLEYERNTLYQVDIPVFYIKGNSNAIYDGDGKEYPDILGETPLTQWQGKVALLGDADMKRQLRLIALSLSTLSNYKREKFLVEENKVLAEDSRDAEKVQVIEESRWKMAGQEAHKGSLLIKIADKLCEMAVIYQDKDIGFSELSVLNESNRSIAPMGMYLYDGIAGVSVFMAYIMKYFFSERYVNIWALLITKLFRYTDEIEVEETKSNISIKPESNHVGAFVGEGSIVNAYIILYKITGDTIFLQYAKRHSEIVKKLTDKEVSMDLLSGCTGAIVVMLKLYQVTGVEEYVDYASRLERKLWESLKKYEYGYGWSMEEGRDGLAGMAHGNSGILLAYAYLLEAYPQKHYVERIEELLKYENSLYDKEERNWKDLRHANGERTSSNAWCHGASGILFSRLKLRKLDAFKNNIQIEKDIERCRYILLHSRDTQEMCLCHGLAGDYLALELLRGYRPDREVEKVCKEVFMHCIEKLNKEEGIAVKERESISLMAGITGTGIALCGGKQLALYLLQ